MQPLPFALAIVNDLWNDELDAGLDEPALDAAREPRPTREAGADAGPEGATAGRKPDHPFAHHPNAARPPRPC